VENVSYQGPRQRVVVALDGAEPVRFIVSVAADERLPVGAGDRVWLHAESDRVHVIEDGGHAAPAHTNGEGSQDAVARA
jgi:hypothetical protein